MQWNFLLPSINVYGSWKWKGEKIPLPWKMGENPWSIPCVQQQVPPNPTSKTYKKVDLPEKESNINSINFCFTSVKFWKEYNKAYCIKAGCAKRYLINVRVTTWNKSFVINYKWCKQRCMLHPYHRKIKYQFFFERECCSQNFFTRTTIIHSQSSRRSNDRSVAERVSNLIRHKNREIL